MQFTKWNGCGNDFILIDAMHMNLPVERVTAVCAKLCDRHFGIGADGIIFILPSKQADFRMRIFNSDGSEAEMCGNGIRCFAREVYESGLTSKQKLSVETGAGIIVPALLPDGRVRVDMGIPRLKASDIPVKGFGEGPVIGEVLANEAGGFRITCVSMGNPHCVIFTEDIRSIDLGKAGPICEHDPHFPMKTNTEFVQKMDGHTLRMRVWERGAGITLACGTGACAVLTAAVLNSIVEKEADIVLDGGTLHVLWDQDTKHIFMTGSAEKVYTGEFLLPEEKI